MPMRDRLDEIELRTDGPTEPDSCVEVDPAPDGVSVVVRSSRSADISELLFTRTEWEAFLRGVKDGEFDLPGRPAS